MKKIISLVLCMIMSLSLVVCVSAADFSDLAAEHWAYENVMTLVKEGTINGYEDGTFKPSKTVTRAEFVKMIGKWDKKIEGPFSDLSSNHWGYEYLVWSGLEADNGYIYPDKAMARADIINLIWKRNGSPENSDAPSAISSQGTNKNATSWAYTIGLVQGDDGLNLRLDNPVTRAEAATLIIRSRTLVNSDNKVDFKDIVSKNVMEQVYYSTGLFNKEYNPDATVTYGELARAAMTIGAAGKSIYYGAGTVNTKDLFEHEYTKDLYALSSMVWGLDHYSESVIDTPVTVQDALSGLMYGFMRRGAKPFDIGVTDCYFSDCVDAESTTFENMFLSYAAINGIKISAGSKLGATKKATMSDIVTLLISMDREFGLEIGYIGDTMYNVETNKDMNSFPANYGDYKSILEGVPASVYNMKQSGTSAESYYKVASELSFVFAGYLREVESLAKNKYGASVTFMYYPSLCYAENNKIIFVAKGILNSESSANLDTILADVVKEKTGVTVQPGQEFFVAFETYNLLTDITLPYTEAYVKDVFIAD